MSSLPAPTPSERDLLFGEVIVIGGEALHPDTVLTTDGPNADRPGSDGPTPNGDPAPGFAYTIVLLPDGVKQPQEGIVRISHPEGCEPGTPGLRLASRFAKAARHLIRYSWGDMAYTCYAVSDEAEALAILDGLKAPAPLSLKDDDESLPF